MSWGTRRIKGGCTEQGQVAGQKDVHASIVLSFSQVHGELCQMVCTTVCVWSNCCALYQLATVIFYVFSCQHALMLTLAQSMPVRPGPGCTTTVVTVTAHNDEKLYRWFQCNTSFKFSFLSFSSPIASSWGHCQLVKLEFEHTMTGSAVAKAKLHKQTANASRV